MSDLILVAGATGEVGREVVRALKARGHRVRALVRSAAKLSALHAQGVEPDEIREGDALSARSLGPACEGVTRVFSCVGASVSSDPKAGRAGYLTVDVPANRNLIDAARAAGVERFVYVSAFTAPQRRDVAYLRAHAEVEDALRASGLRWGIVRPTGFFTAFEEYLHMAARGPVPELGSGAVKTNPIHPADLAEVCADVVLRNDDVERNIGGPEVLTRHQIVELAFEALQKPVRVRRLPVGVAKFGSALAKPFHPRLADLGQFLAAISEVDVVADPVGQHRIRDFFAQRARPAERLTS